VRRSEADDEALSDAAVGGGGGGATLGDDAAGARPTPRRRSYVSMCYLLLFVEFVCVVWMLMCCIV
jgi:hypothetical protein